MTAARSKQVQDVCSMRRSALSLLICTIAVTVSADAAQQASIDKSWRQIVTPDFIVAGTVPAGQLKRTLTELRRFRNSLARLFPDSIVTSSVPTRVVVFRDYREFRRFQPRDSQGKPQANVGDMFSRRPDANIIVLCAAVEESALETIFHE